MIKVRVQQGSTVRLGDKNRQGITHISDNEQKLEM